MASSTTTVKGTARQNQSAWLFMDAANVIFHEAKRRVYIWDEARAQQVRPAGDQDYADDEEALRQAEQGNRPQPATSTAGPVPPEVEPVLEENPKWHLLQEVLDEVEQEIHFTVDANGKSTLTSILLLAFADMFSVVRQTRERATQS